MRDYDIGWEAGRKSALREVLRVIWPALNDDEKDVAGLQEERAETVMQLRELCAEFGDNDWPDELHLGDVIDKHLGRHLRRTE